MNLETLLKLSQNPHYQMSKEQLEMLEKYRTVKHIPTIPKHDPAVPKHNPKMEQKR